MASQNAPSTSHSHHASFITSYLLFGLLHELSHIAIAAIILPSFRQILSLDDIVHDIGQFVTRALLGRYCLIEVDDSSELAAGSTAIIRHFGWMFSLLLAVGLHYYFWRPSKVYEKSSVSSWVATQPSIYVVAAYVTAFEAVTTDLLNLVPIFGQV